MIKDICVGYLGIYWNTAMTGIAKCIRAKHWMENRLPRKQVFRIPNSDSSIKKCLSLDMIGCSDSMVFF
ncbi:hypothetical protein MKW98_008452 [Papaver atlanticum]|uniref:Uncharacterized protein n=1 Tax=Papaver atlanticum TaxID=357466 RepID=A0AAD4XEQ4_9MAGN|nr:hypothetical protein MKW98_008452 [Papaver atlanticum]